MSTPQVKEAPADTELNELSPVTGVGVAVLPATKEPSWPSALLPLRQASGLQRNWSHGSEVFKLMPGSKHSLSRVTGDWLGQAPAMAQSVFTPGSLPLLTHMQSAPAQHRPFICLHSAGMLGPRLQRVQAGKGKTGPGWNGRMQASDHEEKSPCKCQRRRFPVLSMLP